MAHTVPQMGLHWIDPRSPEFNGQPFSATFLFGSSDGRFTFEEPMITRAFLQSRPHHITQNLPQPPKWARDGRYATRWSVRYDADATLYGIELGGLVPRVAV